MKLNANLTYQLILFIRRNSGVFSIFDVIYSQAEARQKKQFGK